MEIFEFAQPIRGGIYLSALVVCVLFVTLIARATFPNKQYLIMLMVLKVCIVLCEWLLLHVSAPNHFFWLSILMVLSFGPAPLLLRFAKGITTNNLTPKIYIARFWEWGIIAASMVLVLPLILASQVLLSVNITPSFGRVIHVTMSACVLLFVFQVLLYWIKAQKIYTTELQNLKQQFSNLKQHSLKILQVLLLLVLSNLVFSLLRTLNVWFWDSQADIAFVANLMEYTLVIWCMFVLFHGSLPIIANTVVGATADGETTSLQGQFKEKQSLNKSDKLPKYAKNTLNPQYRQIIIDKLLNKTITAQLAQDCCISLTKFAAAVGEKPQYISQVLNQDLKTNFYEYITQQRIDEVIKRLSKPSEQTIYEIALEAGFNSKSTFNTAFKRRVGLTPSKFRARKLTGLSAHLS